MNIKPSLKKFFKNLAEGFRSAFNLSGKPYGLYAPHPTSQLEERLSNLEKDLQSIQSDWTSVENDLFKILNDANSTLAKHYQSCAETNCDTCDLFEKHHLN